ncbi:ankyrin repeat-containing protein At5g02620-like [Impatiens glandulifera]|uniref:ankyrin repeat-containing protein At5g02620-like n=1 Tax=Impatiens glandulifera TaxID=253017 RepID=UPI001FB0EE2B|nr:ankyrin repeat-containing protein At5g02620-like [Impatiens glandulifera]
MDVTNRVNQDDLWDAVAKGKIDTLKQRWTQDVSLVYKCKLGCFDQSILHLVASHGYVEDVKNILNHDPELAEVIDSRQWSPLHVAAAKGHMAVLEELLPHSHHVARVKTNHGETILHLCIKHNRLDPLKQLLVDVIKDNEFANRKDAEGNTILHLAVMLGHEPIMDYLLMDKIIDFS